MDIVFRYRDQDFKWDSEKARTNIAKHAVGFEEATEAFFDPFAQYGDATPENSAEVRDFVLGYSASSRLLLVVFMGPGSRTRIISARIATRAERKTYEEEND